MGRGGRGEPSGRVAHLLVLMATVVTTRHWCAGYEYTDVVELVEGDTLLNLWAPSRGASPDLNRPPSYWKDAHFVHVQGSLAPGGSWQQRMFQLPDGFRPFTTNRFLCTTAPDTSSPPHSAQRLVVEITSDGNATIIDDGGVGSVPSIALDGIRFPWTYVDDQGGTVETGMELFSTAALNSAVAAHTSSLQNAGYYHDPDTDTTFLRGSLSLTATCTDCRLFVVPSSAVPLGFENEVAVFPQLVSAGQSDVELTYENGSVVVSVAAGASGHVVNLNAVVMLPTAMLASESQPATQSSLQSGSVAGSAVDSVDWTCTVTQADTDTALATEVPWWRVDLGQESKVWWIGVTSHGSYANALSSFELRVGNDLDDNGNANALCGTTHSLVPGESGLFGCSGLGGQYVNVRRTDNASPLALCEVHVFTTTEVTSQVKSMSVIDPLYHSVFGGWSEWSATTSTRALRDSNQRVCLSGRLSFTPITESYHMQKIGVVRDGWRPPYRVKQPVSCHINGADATCAVIVERNGDTYAVDDQEEPKPAAGSGNWISLSGVCYSGSEYVATIEMQGASSVGVYGDSYMAS